MLTQFFQSINWVDVSLALVLVWVIFNSVKTGFVAEFFRFLGIISALFVSLHYYSYLASLAAEKTSLSEPQWQFIIFVALWAAMVLVFKFLKDGILLLFKVETTHKGFDKYAAGLLGAGRAIFVCSLVIFALLLMRHPVAQRQVTTAWGYKAAAKAAPNTYKFLYQNLIGKLSEGEHFNADVFTVVGSHGVNTK
jgi:uncharacterized membrane protein required for colicin V production